MESLFQAAARRLSRDGFAAPVIVTGNDFRFIVTEQLSACEIAPRAILIEPEGRNTAPAVLAAAQVLAQDDPQALMLVAPSDHVIPDGAAFRGAVLAAARRAQADDLVTFGITPTRAETGYGYLELAPGADPVAVEPQPLARFVEKPDAARAAEMMASGRFLERRHLPVHCRDPDRGLLRACPRGSGSGRESSGRGPYRSGLHPAGGGPMGRGARHLDRLCDHGEGGKPGRHAICLALVGSGRLGRGVAGNGPDAAGNVVSDHATAIGCTETLLRSESARVELVGIGLHDIAAVAMTDAVLVAHKSEAQRVKDAVAALKAQGRAQATAFPVDHRPWGWFESLVVGNRFQVKRIHVHPGAALSLQSHHHRSEHWIVVEGTAKVTIDERVQLVTENQSVYIPLGAAHRWKIPASCRCR